MPIMWFSFCLDHQTQSFYFSAVLRASGHDIDAGGVNAAVTQDIGKLCDVLFDAVESPSKQFPQIMGKHLTFLDSGGLA